MRKESKGITTYRKMLEALKMDPEEIDPLVAHRQTQDESERNAEIRSWIAIGISFGALIVSIFAIYFSQKK